MNKVSVSNPDLHEENLTVLDNNSDTLCPNEPQRKEIGETTSPCRWGLLPLVSSKQILKMDWPPSSTPKRNFLE
jgi:hypothetical protein